MRPAPALLTILILIGGLELGYLSDCFSDYSLVVACAAADTRHVSADRGGRVEQEGEEAAEHVRLDGTKGFRRMGEGLQSAFNSDSLISRFGRPADYRLEATAYTHTGYRTASGVWPRVGIIATDPKLIPLGTRLFVEGYGFCEAGDTGGLIKSGRKDPEGEFADLDLFFETEREAREYGRRHGVRAWVLK